MTPKTEAKLFETFYKGQYLYMALDKDVKTTLREAIAQTGLSPYRLLALRNDIPLGLSPSGINGCIMPSAKRKSIRVDHYKYLLKICTEHKNLKLAAEKRRRRRIGVDRIPVTKDYIEKVYAEIKRTGIPVSRLLQDCKASNKPVLNTVRRILAREFRTALKTDMDLILSEYRKYPDNSYEYKRKPYPIKNNEYEYIKEEYLNRLKRYREKANILPGHIFKQSETVPPGLNVGMVSGWLSGNSRTANPKHVQWVLEECKKLLLEALGED